MVSLQTHCDQAPGHPSTEPAEALIHWHCSSHGTARPWVRWVKVTLEELLCSSQNPLASAVLLQGTPWGRVSHVPASTFSEGWGTAKISFWCQFKSRIQTMGNLSCSVHLMLHKQALRKPECSISLHGCQRLIDQHETC